jgi:sugar phosphate isomerase/epimerase
VRLAVQENLVPGDDVPAKLAAARLAGFDGLELRDSDPERAAALLACGAVFPTCCPEADGFLGDFDPTGRRRAIDRLKRQLDGLAALGGDGVITPAAWGMFSLRLPPFTPPREPVEDRAVLLAGLAELGAHAHAAGVNLLLEPLNRYEDHMVNTVAQAAELVAAAGSSGLRVLADTYHMNIEEDDPLGVLRAVAAAGVLGAVHLSDSNRHQPGTGHVDFAAVLAALREAGFDGALSVECRLRGEPEAALRSCGRLLRELLTH